MTEYFDTNIYIYIYAFCKNIDNQKLKEDPLTIQKNLKFLSRYVKTTDINVHKRVLKIFEETNLYNSSFDVFHLAFCEYNNCKLITFDKGFKKL